MHPADSHPILEDHNDKTFQNIEHESVRALILKYRSGAVWRVRNRKRT